MSRMREDSGGGAEDETAETGEIAERGVTIETGEIGEIDETAETGGSEGAGDPVGAAAERWLSEREGAVPDEFLPWLREDASDAEGQGSEAGTVGRALEARGIEALRRAMASPGRIRESAFRLLTADAYLTWSAEALLDRPDPEAALEALVRRVAQEDH